MQLADEPRLADACRPEERELVGDLLGDRVVERPLELRQLVLTPDEGRVEPARNELGALDETGESEGGERL